jgi:DNA-binding NarL/FixJ family response regulator
MLDQTVRGAKVCTVHTSAAAPVRRSMEAIADASTLALPPRVKQTLECLLRGASEKEVAGMLGISVHTVHTYVKVLYRHLCVRSRAELLVRMLVRREPR